eukprot:CAMPEP_0173129038 /NCGR_PEP_ID=MMETSP1102-20130122/58916_1 /TAXON_ID=49646 /ORGANISM="Geminigera sp., Strain Caron Lab Isolate" /LENGTH=41 /DNA_ID= /DNA_START= /DNA_END= /DNA_ORIENTATION=
MIQSETTHSPPEVDADLPHPNEENILSEKPAFRLVFYNELS